MTVRALYVIDDLALAGAQRQLANVLPHMARHGVDLRVCALGRDLAMAADVTAAGADLVAPQASRWSPLVLSQLVRTVRRQKIQVICSGLAKSIALGRLAAGMTGAGYVIHDHSGPVWDQPGGIVGPWADRFMRHVALRCARRADRIIVVSDHGRDWLQQAVPRTASRIDVIANGVDLDTLTAAWEERAQHRRDLRRELAIPPDAPIVLYAAGSRRVKRWPLFVDTALRLVAEDPRVVFVGAGGGAAVDGLQARIDAAGAADRVRLIGMRDDVPRLMAAADIFLHPSESESDGIVLKEAMSVGLPVIASDIPSVHANLLGGRLGQLIPVPDHDGLAQALRDLLAAPDRRHALGAAARAHALQHFGLDASAAAMARVLTDAAPS